MYLFIIRALEQIFEGKVCRIVIFPVVLCGCETGSLTLGDEHRLRVFENRVLRKVFEPKRVEVVREWRRLHNEELHGLFFFFVALQPPVGQDLLVMGASRTHSDTRQSVGLLWTSDQPDAEITQETDIHSHSGSR